MMGFRKKSGDRAGKQGAAAAKDTDVTKDTGIAKDTDVTEAGDTVSGSDTVESTASAGPAGPDEAASSEAASEAAAADDAESARTSGRPPKRTSNRRLVAVAVAGAIVFAVFAGVAGWRWSVLSDESPAESNSAFVDQSATVEVADAARSIAEGVFTYDYTDLDAYQSSLKQHLDEKMLDRYQETADQNVEIITQAKTTIQATVADGDVGVQKIDGDKATALLIMSRSGNNNGEQQVSDAAPLRLTMVEDDGQWKADSIDLL